MAENQQPRKDPAVACIRLRVRGALRATLLVAAALLAEGAYAQFVTTPVTTATVGETYVYNAVAVGRGNVEITARLGLPDWLELTPTGNRTATLTGVPTEADTVWSVTLFAEDADCAGVLFFRCDYQTFEIVVSAPPNAAPTVVPPGLEDVSIAVNALLAVDVAPAFTDPDGDVLTYSAAGLPPGLALTGATISGAPVSEQGSPHTITVTAADGRGGTASDAFTLTVVPLDRADVFVDTVAASPSPALTSGPIDLTVTVGNAGPSPSGPVDLTIDLAGNPLTFTTNPCSLSVVDDRQRLACVLEPIEPGAEGTLTLTASAAQPGDVYAIAALVPPAFPVDPEPANDRATLSLNIGDSIASTPAQTLALGATAVAAGDLDGDGFADAVVSVPGGASAALLNSDAPAGLDASLANAGDARRGLADSPISFADTGGGPDIALADLDNDQDLDAVAAKPLGAASAVFVNDGAGVFSLLAEIGPADADDRSVATGDVDGDGYADVVIAGAAGNRLYLNQGGASFLPAEIPESAPGAADVALIDVAGSTLPDLVLAYTAASTVFHENLGGTFGPAVTIDAASAGRIASGDFNGDGFADLVLGRLAPGPNGRPSNPVYLNNGSGGFVAVSVLGASPTADVIAADVDVDGAIDIVSVNTTGAHQVYAGDGDGNFTLNPALIASPGALRGAVAPIGRLQLPDLVLAGRDGISVFFNDGEGNFGLGDTEPPVIALIGPDEVALDVESGYTDAGATATDNIDGTVTPAIDNPVNTGVIGTYTVTFTAMDSAGNAAAPVTRTVTVNPQPSQGGGGGATGWLFVVLLGGASILSRMRRRT